MEIEDTDLMTDYLTKYEKWQNSVYVLLIIFDSPQYKQQQQ